MDGLGGPAGLGGQGWTAETQDFYPFRMHVVVGVFACLVRTVKRAGGISEI